MWTPSILLIYTKWNRGIYYEFIILHHDYKTIY